MADPVNPNPAPAPGNPAPTVIQGISEAEHKSAIEKARLEEREKLRQQLDTANASATQLKAENESLKAASTKLTEELAALRASLKPEGGVDVVKAIESAVGAAETRFRSQSQSEIAQLRADLENERGQRQQLTLDQRKAQLIAAHGGESALIPDMVYGSNEQELLASIEKSKEVFQRVIAKSGGSLPPSTTTNTPAGGPNPTPIVVIPQVHVPQGGPGGQGNPAPAPVGRLPLHEYAKKRQELKNSVSGRYASQVLRQ